MLKQTIVLFGATGDLAAKKLLPALNQWENEEGFCPQILCLGRRPFDTEAYITAIEQKGHFSFSKSIKKCIHYLQLDFSTPKDYVALKDTLHSLETTGVLCFYLAVKPNAFVTIASNLEQSHIFSKGNLNHRLIFEKPFGQDLSSAFAIQHQLETLADEEQLYRIDHYLGKEMVRNILALRFSNQIFAGSWNGTGIDTVYIRSLESEGVADRLDYYNTSGAIRDMIQNHLLQVLALVAMDPPHSLSAEDIRVKKLDVINNISLPEQHHLILGQYKGYREQAPELKNSNTETYAKVVLSLTLPQWKGCQFVLETGKKLNQKCTEIELVFKNHPLCETCSGAFTAQPNRLIIKVHPIEGVHLQFNSKAPGYGYELETVEADYCHSCRIIGNRPEAYVKLLMDAFEGDKTLFTGFEELVAQWRVADSLLALASTLPVTLYNEGVSTLNMTEGVV